MIKNKRSDSQKLIQIVKENTEEEIYGYLDIYQQVQYFCNLK